MTEEEKLNRLMYLLTIQPLYEIEMFQQIYIQKACEHIVDSFKEVLADIENEQKEEIKEKKQREFVDMVNGIIKEGKDGIYS